VLHARLLTLSISRGRSHCICPNERDTCQECPGVLLCFCQCTHQHLWCFLTGGTEQCHAWKLMQGYSMTQSSVDCACCLTACCACLCREACKPSCHTAAPSRKGKYSCQDQTCQEAPATKPGTIRGSIDSSHDRSQSLLAMH